MGENLMNQNLTKILIIDDELLLRNGIKYLCNWEEYGFTIAGEASNGIEGLRLIESVKPDIVITDILMSAMDGIELTEKIKEQYPWIHIIILSSYDNFDYVKSLFKLGVDDYLLKPALEKEALLKLLKKLKNHTSSPATFHASSSQTLKELIHGASMDTNSIMQRFQDAHINFVPKADYILLCGSILGNQTFFSYEKQLSVPLAEEFNSYRRAVCISDQGYLCILLQLKNSEKQLDTNQLYTFVQKLKTILSISVIFSISKIFSDITTTSAQYDSCATLLEYSFYFPDKPFIFFRDIKSHPLDFPYQQLKKSIDPLNLSAAYNILVQYIKNAVRFPSTDVFTLKKQIENALYSIIQALTSAGFQTSSINFEKVKYFKKIDTSENYKILESILKEFFTYLEEIVDNETQKRELDLFFQIQDYIAGNYQMDLKLSDIAQIFHINYTYLSTLFFQKTNQHFSDYLNQIRIEQSKRLLQTENLTIQQIGEKTGFINQGYFSKIFKRYVGISPKEYQKIYHRQNKK